MSVIIMLHYGHGLRNRGGLNGTGPPQNHLVFWLTKSEVGKLKKYIHENQTDKNYNQYIYIVISVKY